MKSGAAGDKVDWGLVEDALAEEGEVTCVLVDEQSKGAFGWEVWGSDGAEDGGKEDGTEDGEDIECGNP